MSNTIIKNALDTLSKGGVSDPKVIAKITELAAEVQNLADKIHVNSETSSIDLSPWEPADRIQVNHVNQVKHVSSIELEPWK